MRRWLAVPAAVAVAGVGGFLVAFALLRGGEGEVGTAASPGGNELLERWQRAMATAAAERQNPFRGVVNGIRLHNVRDEAEVPWWYNFEACGGVVIKEFEAAEGSPLYFRPTYLPSRAKLTEAVGYFTGATVCRGSGEVIAASLRYFADPGYLHIFRNRAAHEWFVDAPAERVKPGQVKGKPAVFVLPAGDPFFSTAMVIIAEPFGITVVQGDGVPFEEVLKVAEGLEP